MVQGLLLSFINAAKAKVLDVDDYPWLGKFKDHPRGWSLNLEAGTMSSLFQLA